MMGKINLDKINSFEPIKPERQSEIKTSQSTPVKPEKTDLPNAKDRVNFSGKAAEVGKLVGDLKQLPEVRTDKVEEIRGKIERGEFAPSAKQIVDAILQDESK